MSRLQIKYLSTVIFFDWKWQVRALFSIRYCLWLQIERRDRWRIGHVVRGQSLPAMVKSNYKQINDVASKDRCSEWVHFACVGINISNESKLLARFHEVDSISTKNSFTQNIEYVDNLDILKIDFLKSVREKSYSEPNCSTWMWEILHDTSARYCCMFENIIVSF